MKHILFLIIIVCQSAIYTQNDQVQKLLTELQEVRKIGGKKIGYAGGPSLFYRLSNKFLECGKKEDFLKLTCSKNPI